MYVKYPQLFCNGAGFNIGILCSSFWSCTGKLRYVTVPPTLRIWTTKTKEEQGVSKFQGSAKKAYRYFES